MPTAKIQAPDGRIFTIEVPEGSTQEQILAFIASQETVKTEPQQQTDPFESFNPAEDISLFGVNANDLKGAANAALNIATDIPVKSIAGLTAAKDIVQGEGLQAAETAARVTDQLQPQLNDQGKAVMTKLGESLASIPGIDEIIQKSQGVSDFTAEALKRVGGLVTDPIGVMSGTDVSGNKEIGENVGAAIGKALPETALIVQGARVPAEKALNSTTITSRYGKNLLDKISKRPEILNRLSATQKQKLIANEISAGNPNINTVTKFLTESGDIAVSKDSRIALKTLGNNVDAKKTDLHCCSSK